MPEEAEKTRRYLEEIGEEVELILGRLQLDFESEVSIETFQTEEFYLEVLGQIFNDQPVVAEEDAERFAAMDTGRRIQYLIDFLATSVLQVELGHINGLNVAKGSLVDIRNFLQLINEMLNIQSEEQAEGEEGPDTPTAAPRSKRSQPKSHSKDFRTSSAKQPVSSQAKSGRKTPTANPNTASKSSEKKPSAKRREKMLSPEPKDMEAAGRDMDGSSASNGLQNKARKSMDKSKKSSKASSAKKQPRGGPEAPTTPLPSHENSKISQRQALRLQKSRELAKKRINFTKKAIPEIISAPDVLKTRSAKSVKPHALAGHKNSFLDTIQAVCSDRNLTKVMHNQNMDPQRLHMTLQRTSAKYECLMKEYLRFAEEKTAWEASVSTPLQCGPHARSIQAFETKMQQKFIMEKQAHEKRIRDLILKFQRLK